MYVFDRRNPVAPVERNGALHPGQENGVEACMPGAHAAKTLGCCICCRRPWDDYQARWRCSSCNIPVLACPSCQGNGPARAAVLCELCSTDAPSPKFWTPDASASTTVQSSSSQA